MRLNPFGFLFENAQYPHARTLRTNFLGKWIDTFGVWSGSPPSQGAEDQAEPEVALSLRESLSRLTKETWENIGLLDWATLFSLKIVSFGLAVSSLTLLYGAKAVAGEMQKLGERSEQTSNGSLKAGLSTARLLLGVFAAAPLAISAFAIGLASAAVGAANGIAVGILGLVSLPFVALATGIAALVARPFKNRIRNIKVAETGSESVYDTPELRSSYATVGKAMAVNHWNFDNVLFEKDNAGTCVMKRKDSTVPVPPIPVSLNAEDPAETEALNQLNLLRRSR